MSTMRSWSRFLLIGALLAVVPAARAQEEGGMTLDEEFARLADEIPGFGGLYLDAEGTTHVYLTDLSRAREVQNLGERVEVHQGEYDFRNLFAWKDEVRPLLERSGAVFLDIDEQRNRLLFGVERDALKTFDSELQDFLRGTRVPPEAVIVEVGDPFEPQEKLTDKIRPVPMGVQIQRSGFCTLGVNAVRSGVKGFVTCSHCTATRSVVEGSVFFQSTTGSANQIGVETVDPPFFVFNGFNGCPPGRLCRHSDAVFVAYDSASLSEKGKIANPLSCGFAAGTVEIDPAQPRRSLTGYTFGSPLVGAPVTKVGRTTGCTIGFHTNTCVDANVFLTNITMLCQNRVSGVSAGGDSGSPVFLDGGDEATLVGVLWGGGSGFYVYSPWLFVHAELGGLITPDLP
ncbi:MAG: hypothetical protein ACJ76J_22930 [Thermoanaerobaculia bacterium]